jgi:cytochrome o ubiquinol oxidase operon protein cyoD
MAKQQLSSQDRQSLFSYVIGFMLSIVLTLIAYSVVVAHINSQHNSPSHRTILYVVLFLAMVQFIVQVVFFLHLGRESKPRWNTIALYFMVMVVTVLVAGTLWIMDNLDYRHPHIDQPTDSHIIEDEGINPR